MENMFQIYIPLRIKKILELEKELNESSTTQDAIDVYYYIYKFGSKNIYDREIKNYTNVSYELFESILNSEEALSQKQYMLLNDTENVKKNYIKITQL